MIFGASRQNLFALCSDLEAINVICDTSKKKIMSICKASLKLATSTAIFSMLSSLNANPALADHLDFTLYNETSGSIYFLFVSPARSDSWGPDILGDDILRSGEYMRVTFPNQNSNSPCIWDVKVVFQDQTDSVDRHNLCEIDSITVR